MRCCRQPPTLVREYTPASVLSYRNTHANLCFRGAYALPVSGPTPVFRLREFIPMAKIVFAVSIKCTRRTGDRRDDYASRGSFGSPMADRRTVTGDGNLSGVTGRPREKVFPRGKIYPACRLEILLHGSCTRNSGRHV